MVRAGRIAATLAGALLAAGCSSVTGGAGSARPAASSSTSTRPDFPSSSAAPPSTPAPTPTGPATPTTAQRTAALAAAAGGQQVSGLVSVPGGYEAATFDQRGALRFWADPADSLSWRQLGASRYPYSAALGSPQARVQGALLRNMRHATYIVTGLFTGDGSGNAVAFTTGTRGWGAIKAEPNGNIGPSGSPVKADRIGLSFGFAFANGYLVTGDCPRDRPLSECGKHPVVKQWVWTGSDFRRVR